MPKGFSDEQWRGIVELAHAALELPKPKRPAFVQSRSTDPQIARQALELADDLEEGEAESPGLVGTHIGRFLLTDYLGAGGAGEVYAARDTELGRTVAVKLLRPDRTGLRGANERFIREAKIASALNHPHIVTVHEVIRTEPLLAIVMEFVDGVPLRQRCGAPLPLGELLAVGQQIAQALAAAHAAGVVHRDIKPENVMVRPDGHVKVLDFGLARWTGPEREKSRLTTHAAFPAGTLRYMAPEHYHGEPITAQSDLFAFGLMLYELSTGQHPFAHHAPLEVLHALATEQPAPPSRLNSRLPPRLNSTILAMLAKDPAQRPPAEVVAAALRECESAAALPAVPTRVRRWTIPGRRWPAAAAALLLASVAAAVWTLLPARTTFGNLEQITRLGPENRATAAAISGDGKFLAYANVDGVFLETLQSGETSTLSGPRDFIVDHLAWLPDGTYLIASGFSTEAHRPSIWSLPITGSAAREVRGDARRGAPSPDGSRIAFVSGDYSAIWTMDASGQEATRVVQGPSADTFTMVSWSAEGRHLFYQRRHYSGQQDLGFVMFDRYYERSVESANAQTGVIAGRLENVWIRSAVSLPAGGFLFLRSPIVGMDRTNELWEAKIDPASGRFTGSPQKVSTLLKTDGYASGLSATRDGKTLAVLRHKFHPATYVADFDRAARRFSNARRLTLDDRECYPHAWTADSRAVIFEANRHGSYDLFRQTLDQRVPETIIATPKRWEVLPQLSPDGRFVLYAAGPASGGPNPYTLMRVPVDGGVLHPVPTNGPLDQFRCSTHPTGRCVIRTTNGRSEYVYSELDPVRGIGRELARTSWLPSLTGDWDVSPDGARVAVPNHDSRSARIRVIRLDGESKEPRESELDLAGLSDLTGLAWAADGTGWFVTAGTSVGRRMLFCDRQGRLHPLGDIHGLAVPAPDGKRVAYLDNTTESNAWTLTRR